MPDQGKDGGALNRLVRRVVDSAAKEVADHRQAVRKEQEEVKKRGDEIEERIKRGVRPGGKRFRL